MRLIGARVLGFQSFSDSGEVEFSEGINLVIGQNNSGKSALLRALLPSFPDDRHRTLEKWETQRLRLPKVIMTIAVSGAEIHDWILRAGSQQFFPVAPSQAQDVAAYMHEVFRRASLPISVVQVPGNIFATSYPSHRLFRYVAGGQVCALVTPDSGELSMQAMHRGDDSLPSLLWNAWQRDMFYFAANE